MRLLPFFYFCFLLSFFSVGMYAQSKNIVTLAPYNYSDPGRYLTLEYSRILKNDFQLNIGLVAHYNKNKINPDRHQEYYLHHRFKAYKPSEFIGFSMGGQKNIYCFPSRLVNLFVYDQIMFRHMGARSMRFVAFDTINSINPISGTMDTVELSRTSYTDIHKLFSIENIVGVGLSAAISNRISFNMKFGIGFNFISNLPKDIFKTKSIVEYSIQHSAGLSYSF